MVFVNKKDYFIHSHRTEFKFLTFAVFGTVLAFLGRYSAFFENIDGIIGCDSAFKTLWSCAVVPVASAVISLIMCGTRETLVAVMCGKIGATLIGKEIEDGTASAVYALKSGEVVNELIIIITDQKGKLAVVAMTGEIPLDKLHKIAELREK